MGLIDRYLDRVCRGLSGTRSLRQHLRQELREHLLDAAAEHRAGGMSEEESLIKAIEDFGGPEQVHSELAAQHGQRVTTLLIDKAIEWKEKTMRAKWLWASWAYLTLGAVIFVELFFLVFVMLKIMPVHQLIEQRGWLGSEADAAQGWVNTVKPAIGFSIDVSKLFVQWFWLWFALIAVSVGLFEWRVRSENKSLMRLAALGSVALALMALVFLTAGGLVVAYAIAVPTAVAQRPERIVADQADRLDHFIGDMDEALAQKDWPAIERLAQEGYGASRQVRDMGAAAPTISALKVTTPQQLQEIRAQLDSASESLLAAWNASRTHDESRLQKSLEQFRTSYTPLEISAAKVKPKQ
ncbi:MAG TPA: permease prefix domain 1-containing protein [Pirellulaceae bacterium]|nr:permease prefix domain 1-containing protein [Pirellulaceae bacterium]